MANPFARFVRAAAVSIGIFVLIGALHPQREFIWYESKKRWPLRLFFGETVSSRLEQYGPESRTRLEALTARAHIAYPPKRLRFVVSKRERTFDVYASGDAEGDAFVFLHRWPVLAASGGAGPKQRQGDRQVPEGFYRLDGLNPNSTYHLSMRVNYPNDFDRAQASEEGRTNLGGDIFIHGKAVSIGCVAIGDRAIEDVFVLVGDVGYERAEGWIAPLDWREDAEAEVDGAPEWMEPVYAELRQKMRALPPAR